MCISWGVVRGPWPTEVVTFVGEEGGGEGLGRCSAAEDCGRVARHLQVAAVRVVLVHRLRWLNSDRGEGKGGVVRAASFGSGGWSGSRPAAPPSRGGGGAQGRLRRQ